MNCCTGVQDILKRQTEYCAELYKHIVESDPELLSFPPATNTDNCVIFREEGEATADGKEGKIFRNIHCPGGAAPSKTQEYMPQ